MPLQAPSVWMVMCFNAATNRFRGQSAILTGRSGLAIGKTALRGRKADANQRLDLRALHAAAREGECALTELEASTIRAVMSNESCSYNITLDAILAGPGH